MSSLRNTKSRIFTAEFSLVRVLLAGVGAVALTAAASAARADSQPTTGLYIGGAAGSNLEEGNRFRNGGGNSTDTYEMGYAGTMSLGYGLGNGLRLEIEPGYRNNAVDRVNGTEHGSRMQTITVMGNVLYDFNRFQTPWVPLTPHVGGGIGYAHVWDRSVAPNGHNVSGDTNRLAFQAIGGLDYSLTPHQKIGFDYRYMVVHDASFPTVGSGSAHAGDLNNHTFLATYRYEFNAPAAAPPPPQPTAAAATTAAPPPPPRAATPQVYEVYFEFDRATLTPDARQVVQQAAQNAQRGNPTQLIATGHTDTVGTDSYNLQLSKRRAAAVKTELVRDGVPANQIATSGVGENDLAVQTGQNVNEPRNRRVEITVQAPGM